MPKLISWIREDVTAVLERDPAAKSHLELFLCYSGLHALWFYRINHSENHFLASCSIPDLILNLMCVSPKIALRV
jgi:serine acetyltransferase